MASVFEMNRRARQPIKCSSCGDTIEAGDRYVSRRRKENRLGWVDHNICAECVVFGRPEYSVFDLGPFAPDRW